MDIATILGIISAFGIVIVAIFMGGSIKLFINIPALMIVIGGTLGATMINYPLRDVFGVFSVVKKAFFTTKISVDEIIKRFIGFARKSRREGILSLENEIEDVTDEFLKKESSSPSMAWNHKRSKKSWKRSSILSEIDMSWAQKSLQLWENFLLPSVL